MHISEKLRMQLLKEEFKLRKKQPQSWTAQKYRKYANIGVKKKKEKPEFIEEERDLQEERLLQPWLEKEKKEKAKHAAKQKKEKKARRIKKEKALRKARANKKARKAKARAVKKAKRKKR